MGVQPSSYPVNLIHLFTSGPQEAIIQISLKPGAPRGEPLREKLRQSFAHELPGTQISFEAGDIVSPGDELRLAHAGRSSGAGRQPAGQLRFAQKVRGELAKLDFPARPAVSPRSSNYPTLDITIDRERAGQFGLTMADVVRSVVPATSSSRFTDPNYWRDPVSGNAFQIQVELPQNRMQSVEAIGDAAGHARRRIAARS